MLKRMHKVGFPMFGHKLLEYAPPPRHLVSAMLALKPDKRRSAARLLHFKWFKQV
jgi:hypothetical protein